MNGIPYNNLQNIKYLTKGGFSEIYTAKWIGGRYKVWNSKEKKLEKTRKKIEPKIAQKNNLIKYLFGVGIAFTGVYLIYKWFNHKNHKQK